MVKKAYQMLHPDYLATLSAYEFQKHVENPEIKRELITLLCGFDKQDKISAKKEALLSNPYNSIEAY